MIKFTKDIRLFIDRKNYIGEYTHGFHISFSKDQVFDAKLIMCDGDYCDFEFEGNLCREAPRNSIINLGPSI